MKKEAITSVEQNGIVFIDEIDKIVSTGDYRGADASSEGVQRDLLLVRAPREGTVLQLNVRPGEYAVPGAAEYSLLLGRTKELQLRADVDEDNAPRVKAGCQAIAFIKGGHYDAVPLRFVRIEPYIVPKRSLTGESGERVDTRVLQVIFRFDRTSVPVYVGQQMDVFLNAE